MTYEIIYIYIYIYCYILIICIIIKQITNIFKSECSYENSNISDVSETAVILALKSLQSCKQECNSDAHCSYMRWNKEMQICFIHKITFYNNFYITSWSYVPVLKKLDCRKVYQQEAQLSEVKAYSLANASLQVGYCYFPFMFDGILHSDCAYLSTLYRWCPIAVGHYNNPFTADGQWGICKQGYTSLITPIHTPSLLCYLFSLQ